MEGGCGGGKRFPFMTIVPVRNRGAFIVPFQHYPILMPKIATDA